MTIRLVFFGTGHLALPAFLALRDSTHSVVGLVTQPDRTGRGHHQHVNPLKVAAVERGIAVLQPDSIKTPEAIADLQALHADLFVVAAYGQLLSPAVLAVPPLGTINIHASLLPKYRGATPIHAAILNGDAETGVTIIEIEPKMDAGPMLGRVTTPIGADETTGQLEQRLADLAVPLILRVIDEIVAGSVPREIQDPAQVVRVRKLAKQDGRIDWTQSAEQVARHVRAMQPWPGPFTELHLSDKPPLRIQVLSVEVSPSESSGPTIAKCPSNTGMRVAGATRLRSSVAPATEILGPTICDSSTSRAGSTGHSELQANEPEERPIEPALCDSGQPGEVIAVSNQDITIRCSTGAVRVLSLQPDGKRPMSASEFLRGRRIVPGDRFA